MKFFLLPLLAVTLFTTACEKEVDLKLPDQEAQLTLHSITRAGDTITASVGRSRSILAPRVDSTLFVTNATVVLWEESLPADTLRYDATQQVYVSRTVATPGRRYRIRAMAAGLAAAEATVVAPVRVTIQAVQRTQRARNTPDNVLDELRITFTDPATTGDFYTFDLIGRWPDWSAPDTLTIEQSLQACVQTADADVEAIFGVNPGSIGVGSIGCTELSYLFLCDERFNGQQKELRIYVPNFLLEQLFDSTGSGATYIPPVLQLIHRGEAQMRYLRSRESYYNAEGNPFAEPVNVVGNVQGGYGIFAIESVDEREVQ